MKKSILLTSIFLVAILTASAVVMAQNGNLPFLIHPEEIGNHDGDHEYPVINGSISVSEGYNGNLTTLAIINEPVAQTIALNYTTGGSVVTSELEVENGYLVWNVDVLFQSVNYEILIDAGTGAVLWASQDDNSD